MAFIFEDGTNYDAFFDANTPSAFEAATDMFDPAHPGDLMREIIEGWGVSVTQAATESKLQRTHLSAMLSGDKPVTIESAIKFEAAFGGPAPAVIHGMSDLYESAKALRRRDELVETIVRMSAERADELRSNKKRTREAA